MADLHSKIDELTDLVERAKGVPMSASCVLHRSELLGAIDEIRQLLPTEIARAGRVLRDKEGVLNSGRQQAEAIIAAATAERARLVGKNEVAAQARREAAELIAAAREQADTMRSEVEDYVDGKLANFEVVLGRTIAAVERGRDKLRGRDDSGLAGDDQD